MPSVSTIVSFWSNKELEKIFQKNLAKWIALCYVKTIKAKISSNWEKIT